MAGTRNYDFLVCAPSNPQAGAGQPNSPTFTLDKTAAHRRLGRRQIVLSTPFQRGQFHPQFHYHHRNRLQDPDD